MAQIRKFRGVFLMFLCTLLVFMTLLTVRPQVTYACSCVMPLQPLEAMENSTAVFEGIVTSIEASDKPLQSSADPLQVTLQVGARWKGEVGKEVTLSTAQSSVSCGFEFTEGERYLVYARGEADGAEEKGGEEKSKLTASLCSRTKKYVNAQKDLNELGAGNGGLSKAESPDMAEGDGTKANPPDMTEGDGAEANLPDMVEGDGAEASPPDMVEGDGAEASPPDMVEGDGAEANLPDNAEGDGPALSENSSSAAAAPWFLYVGVGAGIVIVITILLTWLRRRADKPGK